MAKKGAKKKEEPEELPAIMDKPDVEAKPKIFGNKTPKTIKVIYLKGNMRHAGRTQSSYQFTGGVPVTIDNPTDVKFFMLKAEKNPETWKVG